MKTYIVDFDMAQSTPKTIKVPYDTSYMLCVRLYDGKNEHNAWDGTDGEGNVLIADGSYRAKYDYAGSSKTKWHNPADALSKTPTVIGNAVYIEMPNIASDAQYTLLINNTGTSLETVPEADAEVAETSTSTAMPWRMSMLSLHVKPCMLVSENPGIGGIEMTGTYTDDSEFSFTISGVENVIA